MKRKPIDPGTIPLSFAIATDMIASTLRAASRWVIQFLEEEHNARLLPTERLVRRARVETATDPGGK